MVKTAEREKKEESEGSLETCQMFFPHQHQSSVLNGKMNFALSHHATTLVLCSTDTLKNYKMYQNKQIPKKLNNNNKNN